MRPPGSVLGAAFRGLAGWRLVHGPAPLRRHKWRLCCEASSYVRGRSDEERWCPMRRVSWRAWHRCSAN